VLGIQHQTKIKISALRKFTWVGEGSQGEDRLSIRKINKLCSILDAKKYYRAKESKVGIQIQGEE
jgi:hypothetical protein